MTQNPNRKIGKQYYSNLVSNNKNRADWDPLLIFEFISEIVDYEGPSGDKLDNIMKA